MLRFSDFRNHPCRSLLPVIIRQASHWQSILKKGIMILCLAIDTGERHPPTDHNQSTTVLHELGEKLQPVRMRDRGAKHMRVKEKAV